MKPIFTTLAVLFTIYSQAQSDSVTKYIVDYKLEYNITYYHDSLKSHKITYYVNSKSNSYFAMASPDKQGKLTLYFTDYNGKAFSGHISQDSLTLIENRGLAQKVFAYYENRYKYQVKNYDFLSLGDTIVNNRNCTVFLFRSTNPKKEKKKKLWHQVFFIDTSKKIAPVLIHATAYEVYKKRHQLPDGVIAQIDNYNTDNKLMSTEQLTSVTPVNFSIKLIGEPAKKYVITIK